MHHQADHYRHQDGNEAEAHSAQFIYFLNKPIYDEESDRTLMDVISGSKVTDPEELVISREEFIDIESNLEEFLSELEWNVLYVLLRGQVLPGNCG